jgi:hypothetical protein
MSRYGEAPIDLGTVDLDLVEMMHWLYLPVKMAGGRGIRIPPNLGLHGGSGRLLQLVEDLCYWGEFDDHYVYVTARNGYATPDNPINRPGWHTDGFGTDDVNFIWSNRWPTRWSPSDFGDVSTSHIDSMRQFTERATTIEHMEAGHLYRLSPYVVHTAPEIPPPGGMRQFLKISCSKHKYNLVGNSHNYEFDYLWPMVDRDMIRNDPSAAGKDYHP